MGSVGFPEILVILFVALIVLGPDKLPNAARQIGRAMAEFRRITGGFEDEVRKAIDLDSEAPDDNGPSPAPPPSSARSAHAAGDDIPPPRD